MSDRQWIREALDRFEAPLFAYARRITGEQEAARDVVQDTFQRLLGQRAEDVRPKLRQWLFTVCRNRALDLKRKERGMKTAPLDAETAAGEADPRARAEREEERGRMLAFLGTLPARQQEVLRLRFQGGLSYREISGVTGESMGNVAWHLHQGLVHLRALLLGEQAPAARAIRGEVKS